jgi:hypothetical protein
LDYLRKLSLEEWERFSKGVFLKQRHVQRALAGIPAGSAMGSGLVRADDFSSWSKRMSITFSGYTRPGALLELGLGNVTGDPQFKARGQSDYRLLLSSPCVDAGTNLAGIAADLVGNVRPRRIRGAAISDMGACEMPPVPGSTVLVY